MPRIDGQAADPIIERMRGGDTRVRSLLITIYHDLILPRGGEIGITALQRIFEVLGLEPGAVRTAVSRLVADGWLVRRRDGRASYYRLVESLVHDTTDGARRVYAARGRMSSVNWMLVHCQDAEAHGVAAKLLEAGFLTPVRDVFLWPLVRPAPQDVIPSDAIVTRGVLGLGPAHRQALCPPDTAAAYRALSRDIVQVRADLEAGTLTMERAIALRLLLIHRWQGILLSHPELSAETEPTDWPSEETRAQVAGLYRAVLPLSEAWLRKNVLETRGVAQKDLPTRF